MKKHDLFKMIMKATAIYLFVLAIISIPSVVSSFIRIVLNWHNILSIIVGEATDGQIMSVAVMFDANSITKIFVFVFYLVIGIDLMKEGHIIKFVLENGTTQQ
ncbi:hypothetical protein ACFL2O_07225 [Thermodesulfobacteriota bacterium]